MISTREFPMYVWFVKSNMITITRAFAGEHYILFFPSLFDISQPESSEFFTFILKHNILVLVGNNTNTIIDILDQSWEVQYSRALQYFTSWLAKALRWPPKRQQLLDEMIRSFTTSKPARAYKTIPKRSFLYTARLQSIWKWLETRFFVPL